MPIKQELTPNDIDDYVKSGWAHCQYCKSNQIEGAGGYDADGNTIAHEITCLDCGKHWHDIYTLTGIQPID